MSASSLSTTTPALAAAAEKPRLRVEPSPAATALLLVALDGVVVLVGAVLGVYLWGFVNPGVTLAQYFDLGLSLTLFLMLYQAFGLYAPTGMGPVEELRRIVLATALVSLLLTAAVFLTKQGAVYSRGAFLLSGALIAVFVPVARAALRSACAARPWWGVPVLILGAGRTGRLLVEKLKEEPGLGLKPVACLDDDPSKQTDELGVPVIGPLLLAPVLAKERSIKHILIAMPGVEREKLVEIIEHYGAPFARVIVIPNLFGMASLWVTTHDMGGVLGLEVRQNLLDPANRMIKRLIDLVLAGTLGLLSLPVIGVAAIWIKRVSPGPVFYSQVREGQGGKQLRVRKLRTMYPNSQKLLKKHLASSAEARTEWRRYYKLKHDPRILPGIGRLLRRTSLDELPQLWSVIKGEMSLVGPRPFPAYHLGRFGQKFRAFRRCVRPGLTGLWQVSARSEGDLAVQQELDTYYIRNWSLWLELFILARTVIIVLRGRGAY